MKSINLVLVLILSIVQISYAQLDNQGFEKIITTIDFEGNEPDTTINTIAYDSKGDVVVEEDYKYISSYPIKIDTTLISDQKKIIEYTWADQSKSFTQEINTAKERIEIGIDRNGIDTSFFSSFQFGDNGLLSNGVIINHYGTSRYEINEFFSFEEIQEILSNIESNSEFIALHGNVQFQSRERITIIDPLENRNRTEIVLDKKLRPQIVIKRKWHDFHKMIFENRYTYQYQSDQLMELRNVDDDGDLVFLRIFEYQTK